VIRLEGTVEYLDGRPPDSFHGGPALFVAWENYARRQGLEAYNQGNAQTLNHYLAYVALEAAEGFDVWLRGVVGVDVDVDTGGAVPPTVPALSLDSSSSLQFSRDGA